MPMQVEVVSPQLILYSGEADMVTCRTESGDIAFLPHHAAFLGALQIHQVKIVQPGGVEQLAAVRGGVVEVSNNRVIILSDEALLPADIDPQQAVRDRDEAEQRLMHEHDAEVEAELRWAHARLVASGQPT
jgi:F-type H+-transporting ATPase subunit epsilon